LNKVFFVLTVNVLGSLFLVDSRPYEIQVGVQINFSTSFEVKVSKTPSH